MSEQNGSVLVVDEATVTRSWQVRVRESPFDPRSYNGKSSPVAQNEQLEELTPEELPPTLVQGQQTILAQKIGCS